MRISVKADYAIRATAELEYLKAEAPITAEKIARAQGIPVKFLLNILNELSRAQIVRGHRGINGGFALARPGSEITLADVIRAVEGPLANVHESRPEELEYSGPSESLRDVWIAVRVSLRRVLEAVTLEDLARGSLPKVVMDLSREPDALTSR